MTILIEQPADHVGGKEIVSDTNELVLDGGFVMPKMESESANVLLVSAKIAVRSMSKAAVVARAEDEQRAKEAAFTRIREKEAMEYVVYLVVTEKVRKKEAALFISPNVSGPMVGRTWLILVVLVLKVVGM
ncbi:unnamed protein product [Fraxinus pennsylvanica]|uniref:Uncharacterized protein n=1 Tax=Fraxinus pennsylvanica TaxID=56036 RepID=A0AAD2E891_9LAMI|nr:unnamed protein product [Fraxinus pennsylvanica]